MLRTAYWILAAPLLLVAALAGGIFVVVITAAVGLSQAYLWALDRLHDALVAKEDG